MLIIATIGVNTFSEENVKKIILAGADALRYGFTYGTIEDNIAHMETGIKVIDGLNSSAKVIANLPSNKVRLDSSVKPTEVDENDDIFLCSAQCDMKDKKIIRVDTKNLAQKVYVNQITAIDHGKIAIQITEIINNDTIKARVLNNGVIQATHGINISQNAEEDEFLDKCKLILSRLEKVCPQYIAIPFISPNINEKIKTLSNYDWEVKKLIKIENNAGAENLETICKDPFYDGVVVNRGELGNTMPFEKLGIFQKKAINIIKKYKKQVIISSQILEGTIDNFVPPRSDILDLTNIILDGADGIMLCNETALGMRPAYTLSVAKKIILETEKYKQALYCKI